MGLTDICRIFLPTGAEYTFFSTAHGTFSKIDHRTSINKQKKTEMKYNGRKVGINSKTYCRNYTNRWRLNNKLLNDR
jgi:hypothetical protein